MDRLARAAAAFSLASICLALTGCGGAEPTRLQLKPGDTRTGSVETTSEFEMNMGMQMTFSTSETLRLKLTVDEVAPEEGPISLTATVDDYKVAIRMNGQDLMAMPMVKAMLDDSLKAIQGKSFAFTVSPRGEVLGVTGAEEIAEAFQKSSELPMDGMMASQALSAEQLQRHCSMLFCPLPLEPLAEGATWRTEQTTQGAFDAAIAYDWTVKDQNDSFITFAATTTMSGSAPGGADSEGVSGTGEATREIEIATGWVVAGNETAQLNGKISPPGMPPGVGPLDLKGTVTTVAKTY